MSDNDFGAYPTHPGEVIKDEIEYRKISQRKLAENIGMSHTALNEILNGHRSLTTTTAFLFEAALGVPAALLLRIQLRYDMQMAKSDKKLLDRLASIKRIAAVLRPEALPCNGRDVSTSRSFLS